ncbi:SDR family NAD(P)-dependent oxidoreductase [Falsiroseomonas sp.]|uniref:SDR family NAD(P)-dependent oxidoreductase n=1 Tax=Falsiroseomonas sp. TaxID=2870721 RepID=UPI00271BA2F2|nr:SDR family NAD(P)-dependent oxidoreductase [Falsiroseomonas sp.]MDO9498896.1 SDR family NAD(P)-dependent oxidoreductase [Falsiroseomonas sp.]MDP3416325.1 SDR family NAD(P)-dependent oxidoreductase [Falsiroseomonas sp.]
MLDPVGRVVLITGGSRGIGREVLRRLHGSGWMISAGIRSAGKLVAGPDLMLHRWDAEKEGSAEAWVAATMARFGRIDAVVNAAGINPMARLLDADETPHDAMWQVNVKAPMRVIRAAWPHLIESGEGRVVNLASLSGKRVANENLGYAMSKFAVVALTQEVRRLGWEHGIRATAICPGFVQTEMTLHAKYPREAMSRPEDVATLVEMVLRLPNTAAVGEIKVNCRFEALL